MTTTCVIQARFGSSRLPGKVLEDVGGVPMLAKVVARMRRATSVDRIVVATTTERGDDAVAVAARHAGAHVVRGSAYDVLDRFHAVLEAFPDTSVVVRITADCPFADPGIVDELVALREARDADFVANRLPPPARRTYPVGLDVEVCTASALERAWREAGAPFEREHVMPYLYDEPGRFKVHVIDLEDDLSRYRWTVDLPADLEVARALDAKCGPEPFGWRRVLEAAREHPEIALANQSFEQKSVDVVDDRWPG